MTDPSSYSLTTSFVARQSGFSEATVRLYADRGIIPSTRNSNGQRQYPQSAVEILNERLRMRAGQPGR
ncbi:MAG TPA: MerR family transcriptional regulator [Steroidobacteraceae bacterium]|nr:MerR family transcriptional regulator [Steroidobacteraceae bacterium]